MTMMLALKLHRSVENLGKEVGKRVLSAGQHGQNFDNRLWCQAGTGCVVISAVGHFLDSLSPQSIDSRAGPLTLPEAMPNPTYVPIKPVTQIQQSN